MPMITLARFIIVAQDADFIDDERQPVLEGVARASCRSWQPPYNYLDKRTCIKHMPFVDQQLRRHVGVYNNTLGCCQLLQHAFLQAGITGSNKYDALSPPA
jgi:hypothetical protein